MSTVKSEPSGRLVRADGDPSPPPAQASVGAVVVTFNRLDLLKEAVAALRSQTRPPDEIIVVNNGSTDGTGGWLASQPDLTVVTQRNLGCSGGFHTGITTAYQKGHDWFWCMDDDTIPDPGALAAFCQAPAFRSGTAGFLASVVLWKDGRCQPLSFPLASGDTWMATVAADHCVRISQATFVSIAVNRKAVRDVGLPVKEFFLMWDDAEFTARISRRFPCYFVLTSTVVHKTPDFDNPGLSHASIKYQFHQRNRVFFLRLQSCSWRARWWAITKYLINDLLLLATLRIRPKHLLWTLRGAFGSVQIDRVQPTLDAPAVTTMRTAPDRGDRARSSDHGRDAVPG
jgi:rhamnopyranosyl-N-acetylglucosaminyl-diphospho-decaprenol beta-1,3/1,4-galactofuranosyltransferase